ncbi:hypothetical protein RRG08_007788 [Elysia crispata]|uniref:Uncharacterized protein n=1 Tax=Elysia crispata TaxID=231223 RepID=A0AAE1B2C7_9GAST|nr:hypothetical protein RRG08_007788 [Elysia crispata]
MHKASSVLGDNPEKGLKRHDGYVPFKRKRKCRGDKSAQEIHKILNKMSVDYHRENWRIQIDTCGQNQYSGRPPCSLLSSHTGEGGLGHMQSLIGQVLIPAPPHCLAHINSDYEGTMLTTITLVTEIQQNCGGDQDKSGNLTVKG